MPEPLSVKDWLRQMIGFAARIQSKNAQLNKYMEMATRITSVPDALRVKGGVDSNRIETAVLGYINMQESISKEIAGLFQLHNDILSVINAVNDQRYRDVLEQYYITGWTWQQIADEHDWDLSWVHRLHKRALAAAEPHYLKKYSAS